MEKRNVTGGGLCCEKIEDIFVHKYGPHIFHTNNKTIWDFVNSLVELTPYNYQPLTKMKNTIYNSQLTMWTFNQSRGVKIPEEKHKKKWKSKNIEINYMIYRIKVCLCRKRYI